MDVRSCQTPTRWGRGSAVGRAPRAAGGTCLALIAGHPSVCADRNDESMHVRCQASGCVPLPATAAPVLAGPVPAM